MSIRKRLAAISAAALIAAAIASPAKAGVICTTSDAQGTCGPYPGYTAITGTTEAPWVSNNVWSPVAGWQQTLTATDPGNWSVDSSIPAGNGGAVVSYPSIDAPFGVAGTNDSEPLSSFSAIRSTFSESMPSTPQTDAEAAYDIWGGPANSPGNDWNYEVMIQHDFSPARTRCYSYEAHATFWNQQWSLCQFGSELIWQPSNGANEQAGTVHILAMLRWLISHGYLPATYGLEDIGYGWEICSTGGVPGTFTLSGFTLTAKSAGA